MAIGDIIVGMDIGTSKVSVVIGEVNNFNQIEIISNCSRKCTGIKKCKIIDEEEVAKSIANVINDAEAETGFKINSSYITIPGKYVTVVQNSITKDVKDKYAGISSKDVQLALMQVKDIEIPENQSLIDIVPDKFILDNGKITEDPIGNLSSSFTLKAQIVLADKEYIKKLVSIFKKVGLDINGLVPVTLAERNLILDVNELNDNVMILDIGAGNTNDISLVLNISEEEAEKLKRQYGLALKSFIDNDNDILLNTVREENRNKTIKSSELIEIMEARIEEIFSLVNKDITLQNIKPRVNNVILTGQGISNINKSDVAGKIILNIPVKMATGRLISTVKPTYRTAYALVRYIASKPFTKSVSSSIDTEGEESFVKTILGKIKEFFYT